MRDALRQKSVFFALIREFFASQDVVEVHTSKLLKNPTTDVYIDSLSVEINRGIGLGQMRYLHSSPELEMKKLISNGSGDIYQICTVFRDNEHGEQNTNEFSLLEFYRLGFDMHQLIDDVANLLKKLGFVDPIRKISYAQAFLEFAEIDIFNTDFLTLKGIAKKHQLNSDFDWIEDLQIFLFTYLIEPKLAQIPICFVYDYPSGQSALAKVRNGVAHRFELYINGVEIANGYDELQTQNDYQNQFEREIKKRQSLKKQEISIDKEFLKQLKTPLPQCSGVAIGLDRMLSQIQKNAL